MTPLQTLGMGPSPLAGVKSQAPPIGVAFALAWRDRRWLAGLAAWIESYCSLVVLDVDAGIEAPAG
jgi:hypothetical protein